MFNSNSKIDRHTLLKQTLADRSDGEEVVHGARCAYDEQPTMTQNRTLHGFLVIEICSSILTLEPTDAHS